VKKEKICGCLFAVDPKSALKINKFKKEYLIEKRKDKKGISKSRLSTVVFPHLQSPTEGDNY